MTRSFGAQMEVTADYRFTSGNSTSRRLFLMIKATKAAGLLQSYYLAELKSIGGRTEDRINAGGIEHGLFEI